ALAPAGGARTSPAAAAQAATSAAARSRSCSVGTSGVNSAEPMPNPLAPTATHSRNPSAPTPPTGTSSTSGGSTARQARTAAGPTWSAGKTFTARAPYRIAVNASDTVATPG